MMIYKLKLKRWPDDTTSIQSKIPSELRTKEQYQELKETFIEHHNCLGLDLEEAEDIFNESPFQQITKWMKRKGYQL